MSTWDRHVGDDIDPEVDIPPEPYWLDEYEIRQVLAWADGRFLRWRLVEAAIDNEETADCQAAIGELLRLGVIGPGAPMPLCRHGDPDPDYCERCLDARHPF